MKLNTKFKPTMAQISLDEDVVAKSQNNIAYAGLRISRCALLKHLRCPIP